MIQFTEFYEEKYQQFLIEAEKNGQTPAQFTPQQKEIFTDKLFQYFDASRLVLARKIRGLRGFLLWLDSLIWTKKTEYLDQENFPLRLKKKVVAALHFKNIFFRTYSTGLDILAPIIKKINLEENRPARILELAAGMGQFTMNMAQLAPKRSLQVEMTGSDIMGEYMEEADQRAKALGIAATFRKIDAYALDQLPPGSYDIAFTLHSMHHFTPGQLAKIISGSQSVVTQAFIGVDGHRGLLNLLFIAVTGGLGSIFSFSRVHFHDAFISGRKMYALKQLEIIARIAAPKSQVTVKHLRPGLALLKVIP